MLNNTSPVDVKYARKSSAHYLFLSAWNIIAHIIYILRVKDLSLLVTDTMSHHSKGFCFGSNRHRRVTDNSSMTAVFIVGLEGERSDGVSSRWGGGALHSAVR